MPAVREEEVALDPEKSYELVNELYEEKERTGAKHAAVCARLTGELGIYLKSHSLGRIYVEAEFRLEKNERIPDIAFVTTKRLPAEGDPDGLLPFAPDLAIEIISPSDLHVKVSSKVLEYLAAGVQQVWLVTPEQRTLTIFRSWTQVQIFAGETDLVSEDLLPGFRCALSDLFNSPAA